MKTSNIQTTHNHAIIRGWVDPVMASTESSGQVEFENASGGALTEGDVVVLDSDGTITTTTTAADTRPVGVVLDDIDAGDFGPVAWSGPVDLINVPGAVTAGDYAQTSTVAGEAIDTPTRGTGSFAVFTSSSATPSGFLFGWGAGSGVAATGSLPWFNVKDYGATGDGTTDDTSAINDAIDAMVAATGGVLYFPDPATAYKTTGALNTISVSCTIMGDGIWGSLVTCTSATAVLFTVSAPGVEFRSLRIDNTHGTPSAGCAIKFDGAGVFLARIDNCDIRDFYDNVDFEDGYVFAVTRSNIYDPVRYSIRVRNVTTPDAGDSVISGCVISAGTQTAAGAAGIRVESSGGLKIIGNKINGTGSDRFVNGIDLAPASDTSILIVNGNSIENVSGDGIHAATSSGVEWDYLIITSNQFGLYGNTTGNAIDINCASLDDIDGVVIADNVYRQSGGGSAAAISLTKVDNAYIGPVVRDGFGSSLATSGCTNVIDNSAGTSGAPTGADYLVGTAHADLSAEIVVGTTPGGELGNTWASPTVDATHSGSAHADFIAKAFIAAKGDLIGGSANDTPALVTVGANGTVLTADSGATAGVSWQTAGGGAAGHYEVIVSGTAPPVAVTNIAEDDWLYGFVAD